MVLWVVPWVQIKVLQGKGHLFHPVQGPVDPVECDHLWVPEGPWGPMPKWVPIPLWVPVALVVQWVRVACVLEALECGDLVQV